jgi:hypothetical protein
MNRCWSIALAASVTAIFGSLVLAGAAEPNIGKNQPAVQDPSRVIQDLTLVGTTVLDSQGQKLGTIKHVVLDPPTGQATFVVLEAEIAGAGHAMLVVPYAALRVSFNASDNRQTVVLNRRPDQLHSAPQIKNNQWEMLRNSQFREQARNFYQVQAYYVARPIENPSSPSLPPTMPGVPAVTPMPQLRADSDSTEDLEGFYNE